MDVGYLLIMVGAFVVGALVRRATTEPLPLPRAQRFAIVLGALVGGTVAAKIPWLVTDPEGLLNGSVWLNDGRTLTFGLVGGYLGVEVAKLALGVKIKTGDSFAVPLAATVSVARVGCFYAGCCFGAECAWPALGVDFGDGVLRHPTQLYEAIFHATAAVVLYRIGKANRIPRQRVKLYIIAYMTYRFFTEWLRPEPRLALDLTLYQWATLAFIPFFALLWWLDREPVANAAALA